ncbi:MAG: membrane protein insertion efficiency factor YidD [Pelolinea sp.]|nr:membrane protein insertion efficiency factor YidD [Pelolinea sp.]
MLTEDNYPKEHSLSDFKVTIFNFPQYLILAFIRLYQRFISPVLPGNTCRFYPSCSHYGYQAVNKYGALKGSLLAIYRIFRCNPFNLGGYDPVP